MDIKKIVKNLLVDIGENPEREGLKETPKRYSTFLKEFLTLPRFNFTTFNSEGYDDMIVESKISFQSLCEHHLVPFFGEGVIAYIPQKRIAGLSKLTRVLEKFSRRLQNQERITRQVADFLDKELEPKGVAVLLTARHLCMEMRGIRKSGVLTTTSCFKGVFKRDLHCKNEFLRLIKNEI